jgi:hypothetical protein
MNIQSNKGSSFFGENTHFPTKSFEVRLFLYPFFQAGTTRTLDNAPRLRDVVLRARDAVLRAWDSVLRAWDVVPRAWDFVLRLRDAVPRLRDVVPRAWDVVPHERVILKHTVGGPARAFPEMGKVREFICIYFIINYLKNSLKL